MFTDRHFIGIDYFPSLFCNSCNVVLTDEVVYFSLIRCHIRSQHFPGYQNTHVLIRIVEHIPVTEPIKLSGLELICESRICVNRNACRGELHLHIPRHRWTLRRPSYIRMVIQRVCHFDNLCRLKAKPLLCIKLKREDIIQLRSCNGINMVHQFRLIWVWGI